MGTERLHRDAELSEFIYPLLYVPEINTDGDLSLTRQELPSISRRTPEAYVHPFKKVPEISQPAFDLEYRDIIEQRATRAEALFALATLNIAENGAATPESDNWLVIMRQNVRDLDGKLALYDEQRMSMLGLVGMYLASDAARHEMDEAIYKDEADVYRNRINRADSVYWNSYDSTTPYHQPHLDIRQTLATIHQDTGPAPEEIADNVLDMIDIAPYVPKPQESPEQSSQPGEQLSPEFLYAKARALFEYATTLPASPEKRDLLFEAIAYADETFARADGDDHALRAESLHIRARAEYDVACIPEAFAAFATKKTNASALARQAKSHSLALLKQATDELNVGFATETLSPDVRYPWAPQVDPHKTKEYIEYFSGDYGNKIINGGDFTTYRDDIIREITNLTARKFGHNIVTICEKQSDSDPMANSLAAAS